MLSLALAAASIALPFSLLSPDKRDHKRWDGNFNYKLIHFHTFPKQIHNQNLLPGLQPRPSGLQLLRCTACSLQQTRFGRGPRTVILGRGGEAP